MGKCKGGTCCVTPPYGGWGSRLDSTEGLHKIRKRYAHTTSTNNVQEKSSKVPRVVPCLKFNKGACLRTGDHEWKDMMLKHMCQYCFTTYGKVEQHARKDCCKAPKEQTKNM